VLHNPLEKSYDFGSSSDADKSPSRKQQRFFRESQNQKINYGPNIRD